MDCEELQQNSAAYALGALSEEEMAKFEQHLAECDLDHEVQSFGDVASRLAAAAPAMEPPAGLRDRILAAAASDSGSVSATGVGPAASSTASRPTAGNAGIVASLWNLSAPAYGAAAMLLIVIGALIGWAISASAGGDDPVSLRHFHREEDGDWFRVETELGRPSMTLSVGNLDTLPAQSTYQFWAVRDEQWLPVGDFNTNPEGRWSGDFEFALEQGDTIAITVEPSDAGDTPTAEPEIRSRI